MKGLVKWKVHVEKFRMLVFQMGPALSAVLPGESKLALSFPEGPHSTWSLLLTKLLLCSEVGVAGEPFQDRSLEASGWLIARLPFGFFPVFYHG